MVAINNEARNSLDRRQQPRCLILALLLYSASYFPHILNHPYIVAVVFYLNFYFILFLFFSAQVGERGRGENLK